MLNPAQRKAVETTEGPLRILAGAGTGKTHTMVARIGYLIEMLKVEPHQILALTFTNKAARELNERLVGLKFPNVQAMTFHALAAKLLRQCWKTDFEILGKKDQESILNDLLYPNEKRDLKTILMDLELIDYRKPKSDLSQERLETIRKNYHEALRSRKSVDFTGLLTTLLDLWEEDEGILEKCQALFRYIMVDEYQDVNGPQVKIVQLLSEKHRNLCVVGDPDQTIYSWRGSDEKSMADFGLQYPEAVSVTLTENYRNPPNILKGAERLIGHNPDRLPKILQAMALKQGEVTLWKSESEAEQCETLVHLLEQFLGSHSTMHQADVLEADRQNDLLKFGDIAILYRTQAEGKRIAAELAKRGYPCQLSAPENFWERREIVDFLLHLDQLKFLETYPDGMKFSHWLRERVGHFVSLGKWTEHQVNRLDLLIPYAMAHDDKPIQEALFEFLDEARTEQEIDNVVDSDKINLLTLHAAKGLEFPIVMIAGLEEGNLPNKKSDEDSEILREERRLLYVGMTRATRDLHLFFCNQKFAETLAPSRFLDEIGYATMLFGKLPEAKVQSIHLRQVKKAQMKLF
jgi:DNA helicase II / ATP-dependent DNA helicase PcrA